MIFFSPLFQLPSLFVKNESIFIVIATLFNVIFSFSFDNYQFIFNSKFLIFKFYLLRISSKILLRCPIFSARKFEMENLAILREVQSIS